MERLRFGVWMMINRFHATEGILIMWYLFRSKSPDIEAESVAPPEPDAEPTLTAEDRVLGLQPILAIDPSNE